MKFKAKYFLVLANVFLSGYVAIMYFLNGKVFTTSTLVFLFISLIFTIFILFFFSRKK